VIVLDASAIVDVLLGREPRAGWVEDWLRQPGQSLRAPHLIDIECANALRKNVLRGVLPAWVAEQRLEALLSLRLRRYPHTRLLGRIWELRGGLTPADAAYVALAEALDAPLVTTDQALARTTGHGARIVAFPAGT
jgi:predicted nucleic acid-binding protein